MTTTLEEEAWQEPKLSTRFKKQRSITLDDIQDRLQGLRSMATTLRWLFETRQGKRSE